MATMDEAYQRDSASERAMTDLRRQIEGYLEGDSPELDRCSMTTRKALEAAAQGLGRDAAHVVAVWD